VSHCLYVLITEPMQGGGEASVSVYLRPTPTRGSSAPAGRLRGRTTRTACRGGSQTPSPTGPPLLLAVGGREVVRRHEVAEVHHEVWKFRNQKKKVNFADARG
jgi:hypothetical protein